MVRKYVSMWIIRGGEALEEGNARKKGALTISKAKAPKTDETKFFDFQKYTPRPLTYSLSIPLSKEKDSPTKIPIKHHIGNPKVKVSK